MSTETDEQMPSAAQLEAARAEELRQMAEAEQPPNPDDPDGDDGEPGEGDQGEPVEPIHGEPEDGKRKRGKRARRSPDEPLTEAELQNRAANALGKYRAELEKLFGPADGMSDCPTCGGMSMVPDGHPLIAPDGGSYGARQDTVACATCEGLGQLYTGSKVAEHALLPCPTCGGSGYTSKPAEAIDPPSNVTQLPPAAAAAQVHGWFDPVTQQFHSYAEAAPS